MATSASNNTTGDTTSFTISVVATSLVMLTDGAIIFLIIKERLWRDDNALLILNLMISFVLSGIWGIFSMASDTFHWDFGFALLLSFQVLPHTSSVVTLICLAFDRVYALKKKTLVKIYSRSYAVRRLICIWVASIVVAAVTFAGAYATNEKLFTEIQFFKVFIICHFSLFAVSMALIIVSFLLVWRIHRHNVQEAASKGTIKDPAWQKRNRISGRLSLTVGGLVLGLIVTWLPLYIYVLIDLEATLQFGQKPMFVFLLLVNYIIAPFMIFSFSVQFRRYFKRRVLCCLYIDPANESTSIDDNLRSSARRTMSLEEGNISPVEKRSFD